MSTGAMQVCLLLGVVVPLASFVFLVFFGTKLPGGGKPVSHDHDDHAPAAPVRGNPTAGWVATAAIGFSFIMAVAVFFTFLGKDAAWRADQASGAAENSVVWANMGSVAIEFGVRLDSLTVIMFLMVTLCATCIHVFSIGYMKNDPRYPWFFAYMSLFCFSMLGLLIAQNLLFLFMFWELVGLCSYLLIGFWFEKKSASNAAIKAFVTNRVGDFGFLIGMFLCYTYLGTLSLDEASARFEASAHEVRLIAAGHESAAAAAIPNEVADRGAGLFRSTFWGVSLATWMGIGLFCGAIGKSAQFPLQVWLPDAMEGPTPVSALIHAATMVAAGVYLVGRIFTLLTPEAQMFIAAIGCITLTMAALIAMVQTDIKRVLAFSTLSQLGYMIFALGIGAWVAALFHLLTHAFFKAMLFLGSGQVIEGCHHEQEMTKMGGLWRKMPGTAFTFFIAVLAISGAGIPWTTLGIGGFYSKDEILVVGYYRHHMWEAGSLTDGGQAAVDQPKIVTVAHAPQEHADEASQAAHAPSAAEHESVDYAAIYSEVPKLPRILFILPILVAYITPFYMGRCFMLTFMGKPRDKHVYEHAHESKLMVYPLFALAIMTVVSGPIIFRDFVARAAPHMPAMVPMVDAGHASAVGHAVHPLIAPLVGFAFIVGLGLAWFVYRDGFRIAGPISKLPVVRPFYNLLWNKFYFDEVYNAVLVMGTRAFAVFCGLFDGWIIDGLVNSAGRITTALASVIGIVDNKIVDGAVNGTGALSWSLGGAFRGTHTGIIRNYILMTAMVVAGVIVGMLWSVSVAVPLVILAACTVAAPRLCYNVVIPVFALGVVLRLGRIVWGGLSQAADAGTWDWSAFTSFWSTYLTSAAGIAELVLLMIIYAVLYARFRGLAAPEPEYAAAS